LYSDDDRALRSQWFASFLEANNQNPNAGAIIAFHSGKHIDDESINMFMQREGGTKTVSITQVTPSNHQLLMRYNDLLTQLNYELAV